MKHRDHGDAQRVKFGLITRGDLGQNVQNIAILERIRHPNYNFQRKINDIALFKLEENIEPNAYVRPACLNYNNNLKWTKAIAAGFGVVQEDDDEGSEHLMKVNLDSIDTKICEKVFKDNGGIDDHQLCVGQLAGGKDTCQGDSGGPLQIVLKEPYCMYSIIGVTSYGKSCGYAQTPGIYASVNYFLQWIENNVWA